MTANTRRRKIAVSAFSRCHPSQGEASRKGDATRKGESTRKGDATRKGEATRKAKGRATRCLPSRVYSRVSYANVGCKEGEDHCLLDRAKGISEEEKKSLRTTYLRPRMPKAWANDPDMWLDNYNIMDVMRQYETAFPWFKFLGVFPIDFSAPNPYLKGSGGKKKTNNQCLYKETCTIQLKKEYANGRRGIGMIFNLDPHYKGGSHWVALYIDLHNLQKPIIGYFDSYGMETPPMIARLMKSFLLQIPECDLVYNARRFQYSNSECGMFSMYFILCMIHGIRMEDFCKDAIHDDAMLELRNVLFSH